MTAASGGPLGRVRVRADPAEPAVRRAAALLAGLGAQVTEERDGGPGDPGLTLAEGDGPAARWSHVRLAGPVDPLPGLPAGVPARAAGALLALLALAALRTGESAVADPADSAIALLLPLVMAASYGAPAPARPEPVAWRDGWLATELGAPGDEEAFGRLLETVPADAGVHEVSAEAQTWRLPVLPYQRWRRQAGRSGESPFAGTEGRWGGAPMRTPSGGARPLSGVRVLDATVMWAGPLATWLLAGLGATVTTIEPAARPDGARAPYGGGIYPHGVLVAGDRDRSAVFNALARGKRRWDLDLRRPEAVAALHHRIGVTDLVIDNLSPRARGQLGMTAAGLRPFNPDLLSVTAPAFGPDDRHRAWVCYGSQVHAISGLAWGVAAETTRPVPAATAYADALTGLHLAVAALAAVVGRDAGWRPAGDLEVPLASSVAGLEPRHRDAGRLASDAGPAAARLLARHADRFERLAAGGENWLHPRHPWDRPGPRTGHDSLTACERTATMPVTGAAR